MVVGFSFCPVTLYVIDPALLHLHFVDKARKMFAFLVLKRFVAKPTSNTFIASKNILYRLQIAIETDPANFLVTHHLACVNFRVQETY